ncbi:LacI family DNA-binding transcriptional regulator, partial [Amycolatopsis magusensis]
MAKAAGVSTATASRVLSGRGPASATARRRVAAAASELGYL